MDLIKLILTMLASPANNTHHLGIITRNKNGNFIAVQSHQDTGMLAPFEGELLASRDGQKLTNGLGLDK